MATLEAARVPDSETGPVNPRSRVARRERKNWRQYVGFTPAAVVFGVFFIAPLCLIVVYSFWQTKDYNLVPEFTTKNYETIATTDTYIKTLGKTILMALLATATTLAIAFPFCYAAAESSVPPRYFAVLDQLPAEGIRLGRDSWRQRRDQRPLEEPRAHR
jgi:ABC-type Fe3+ transport system permease subunit